MLGLIRNTHGEGPRLFFSLVKQTFCSRVALEKHLGREQQISTLSRVTGGRVQVLQPSQLPPVPASAIPAGLGGNVPVPSAQPGREGQEPGICFPRSPLSLAFSVPRDLFQEQGQATRAGPGLVPSSGGSGRAPAIPPGTVTSPISALPGPAA